MSDDFTELEKQEIMRHSSKLIRAGYVTGINYTQSSSALPETAIVIHYLQDSQKQIDHVLNQLNNEKNSALQLPRTTYYVLDPRYTKKPDFRKEYVNAIFLNELLQPKDINAVMKQPENTIIAAHEWDLIIPCTAEMVLPIVRKIVDSDKSGPEKWMHPAIIVRGNHNAPFVQGFYLRDYASLSRQNAEFYSLVADPLRKQRLLKKLETICQELQQSTVAQLWQERVL